MDFLEYVEPGDDNIVKDEDEVAKGDDEVVKGDDDLYDDEHNRRICRAYWTEFADELEDYKKQIKDCDRISGKELDDLRIAVVDKTNTKSVVKSIAEQSKLALIGYEYLMKDIYPVPGISSVLGNNPEYNKIVRKIILKYAGGTLDKTMPPEFQLAGLLFQSSIICNSMAASAVTPPASAATPPASADDTLLMEEYADL